MKHLTKLRKEYEAKINNLMFIREYGKNSKITSGEDIFNNYSDDYKDLEKECFVVFYLDTKNKIIKREIISLGILDSSIIHPREIFKSAVLFSSARIILSHNHPSGDTTPSEEDMAITQKLKEAGELLGITVLDHVIVSKESYYSFVSEKGGELN